jgi:hypothetical protein
VSANSKVEFKYTYVNALIYLPFKYSPTSIYCVQQTDRLNPSALLVGLQMAQVNIMWIMIAVVYTYVGVESGLIHVCYVIQSWPDKNKILYIQIYSENRKTTH